jgi:uncharacterized protein YdgA (DUF945 family)
MNKFLVAAVIVAAGISLGGCWGVAKQVIEDLTNSSEAVAPPA